MIKRNYKEDKPQAKPKKAPCTQKGELPKNKTQAQPQNTKVVQRPFTITTDTASLPNKVLSPKTHGGCKGSSEKEDGIVRPSITYERD